MPRILPTFMDKVGKERPHPEKPRLG